MNNPIIKHDFDVHVESTEFFSAFDFIPGQPGVYEVDFLILADDGERLRRFSYHNGRDFGPVMQTPGDAYVNRFYERKTPVTMFAGLTKGV